MKYDSPIDLYYSGESYEAAQQVVMFCLVHKVLYEGQL